MTTQKKKNKQTISDQNSQSLLVDSFLLGSMFAITTKEFPDLNKVRSLGLKEAAELLKVLESRISCADEDRMKMESHLKELMSTLRNYIGEELELETNVMETRSSLDKLLRDASQSTGYNTEINVNQITKLKASRIGNCIGPNESANNLPPGFIGEIETIVHLDEMNINSDSPMIMKSAGAGGQTRAENLIEEEMKKEKEEDLDEHLINWWYSSSNLAYATDCERYFAPFLYSNKCMDHTSDAGHVPNPKKIGSQIKEREILNWTLFQLYGKCSETAPFTISLGDYQLHALFRDAKIVDDNTNNSTPTTKSNKESDPCRFPRSKLDVEMRRRQSPSKRAAAVASGTTSVLNKDKTDKGVFKFGPSRSHSRIISPKQSTTTSNPGVSPRNRGKGMKPVSSPRVLTQPAMHGLEDFDELIRRLAGGEEYVYVALLQKLRLLSRSHPLAIQLRKSLNHATLSFSGFGPNHSKFGLKTHAIWMTNLDQMRLIYSFYASETEICRQGNRRSQLMIGLQQLKIMLSDYDVFPFYLDFNALLHLYRGVKLWEWYHARKQRLLEAEGKEKLKNESIIDDSPIGCNNNSTSSDKSTSSPQSRSKKLRYPFPYEHTIPSPQSSKGSSSPSLTTPAYKGTLVSPITSNSSSASTRKIRTNGNAGTSPTHSNAFYIDPARPDYGTGTGHMSLGFFAFLEMLSRVATMCHMGGPPHSRSFEEPEEDDEIVHVEGLLRVMDLSEGKTKMALKHRKNHPIRNFQIPPSPRSASTSSSF